MGRFWALGLAVTLALISMVVGTMTGVERLWERWTDYPYNHAFVVFAMSLWLAIDALRRGRTETISPSAIGGSALVLAISAYHAFGALDWTLGMLSMLPLVLLAITATIAGLNVAARLAIPILFLFFSIPVWDLMIAPLQQATITAVSAALRWTGFTAFIDGTFIHIPAGTFEVAGGCAGLRYFIVSLTLAVFYAVLYLRTWKRGLALIAVALVAAILCNWIRVYSLVVIGDLTEMQHYLIAVSHARFGWFIYGFSLIPVFVFAHFLDGREDPPAASRMSERPRVASPSRFLGTAILVSALLVAPVFLLS